MKLAFLIELIKSSGQFQNILENNNDLTAEIDQLLLDYKGFGVSEMLIPMYVARSYVKAFVQIEFKEDRYRVNIKNIKMIQKYVDGLSIRVN